MTILLICLLVANLAFGTYLLVMVTRTRRLLAALQALASINIRDIPSAQAVSERIIAIHNQLELVHDWQSAAATTLARLDPEGPLRDPTRPLVH
jgi:hypothetical protein